MTLQFVPLAEPTPAFVEMYNRWQNDPELVPFIRPSKSQEELDKVEIITYEGFVERLQKLNVFLIYLDDRLVGEMNYTVNPDYLYKKDEDTAWLGINIGEPEARSKGVGYEAISYMEEKIKQAGIRRVELGVFEFNTRAHKLYQKLGYQEIARLKDFTYWNGKMWCDIRMEKYL